jgi:hypothetical protein
LLAPETARTGSGYLVTLTFKILVEPDYFSGDITTVFDLYETKLADDAANPITHVAVDGTYQYYYVMPFPTHYLSINPATTTIPAGAPIVGTANAFFDVYVDVNALNAAFWVVGIEFKLAYDPTLIDYVGIAVDPWLDAFGDIYMVPVIEGPGTIHTAVVLLPHSSPPSHWDFPIDGTGHLVKLTFEVIYQEAFPWYDESPLDLYDAKYSDILANPVPGLDNADGLVRVFGFVVGRQIDLYTCNYPSPYGGQGPGMPSDMFWPQKEVYLCANVSYNLWPEQTRLLPSKYTIH